MSRSPQWRQRTATKTSGSKQKSEKTQSASASGLLTRDQLAMELGVSVNTLRSLVRNGEIPHPIRLGKRLLRWRRADVERALTKL